MDPAAVLQSPTNLKKNNSKILDCVNIIKKIKFDSIFFFVKYSNKTHAVKNKIK